MHVAETFCETVETAAHGVRRKREQCSPHSSSARHGCVATRDNESDSDFGIRPPDPATDEEGGKEKRDFFSRSEDLVSGSLDVLGFPHSVRQSLSQTGDFYTTPTMVGVRTSFTLCVCMLRAISARAWVHLGDGLRRTISAVL